MIVHKEKYETSQFVFWLTQYEHDHYDYDIILASERVAPSANEKELKGLADFINNFLENKNDSSRIA